MSTTQEGAGGQAHLSREHVGVLVHVPEAIFIVELSPKVRQLGLTAGGLRKDREL
jgi:hypothetical protein